MHASRRNFASMYVRQIPYIHLLLVRQPRTCLSLQYSPTCLMSNGGKIKDSVGAYAFLPSYAQLTDAAMYRLGRHRIRSGPSTKRIEEVGSCFGSLVVQSTKHEHTTPSSSRVNTLKGTQKKNQRRNLPTNFVFSLAQDHENYHRTQNERSLQIKRLLCTYVGTAPLTPTSTPRRIKCQL